MDVVRIQLPLVHTPRNGWMVSVRIPAATATFAPPIHVVSHIECATTTLMIANANTDTTSQSLKTNASVIHGVFGNN
jgi:hypothetical protein